MRIEEIGDCRLILGNSRDVAESLSWDSIASDPPFGMAFRSNHRAERHDAIVDDDTTDALLWACSLPARHSKYIFCRWDNVWEIPRPKSLITWVKNNWSMGDLNHEHARQTEVCAFYAGEEHFFPDGRPSDVVDCRRTGNNYHPTEKPVDLMAAIVRWTNGTVFDPFMGSGSTGVACVREGRPFVGVEIDPKHFSTACRRIEAEMHQPRLQLPTPEEPKQEALL